MLFTRCPECETTFRVTDETLKKANGQVRCGRCASVFNAYTELQDPGAKSSGAPPPTSVLTTPRRTESNAAAESTAAGTIADVVAEAAIAEADGKSSGTAEDAPPISARRVDEVLTATVGGGP